MENKEKVGGFSDPNIEKIVSLEPDLVVCNDLHLQFVERLEEFDIPAIILDPKDFDDMFASIELVGQATGQSDKASVLVGDLKARIKAVEDIVAKAADDEPRKVYYEIWPSPMMTSGPGTYVNDIIERAGGENIAKDAKKDFPEYSQEMVVAKNPDIIVFSHHGSSSQSTEDILTRQGWENVNAIKNNRVYYIDENIVQRATPRLVDGLESFAEIIHPELF